MSPTPRDLASLLLATLLLAASPGCGGDERTPASAATTDAARRGAETTKGPVAADGSQRDEIGKREARRVAKATNLRASDLPYFEVQADDEESDPERDRRLERRFSRCAGIPAGLERNVYEEASKTYGTGGGGGALTLTSEVEVAPSAALAARRIGILRKPRTLACLERLYVPDLEEQGSPEADFGRVRIARLPAPRPNPEGALGFRVSARVTFSEGSSKLAAYRPGVAAAESQTLPAYVDIFAFAAGPAEITLTATGIPDPVSKNLEGNLLRLLHERALESLP